MIAVIIFLFFTLYLFCKLFLWTNMLPPEPWSIPFIGNLPLMNIQQCVAMQKRYGNLFMMRVGAYKFLYILDYKLSKEAYCKIEFASRPDFPIFQLFPGERKERRTYGIIFSNGARWYHNRRFLLRHLRDLGMGKSRMEGIIMREAEYLVEDFKTLTDKPTPLPFSINVSVLNMIWLLMSNHRFEFSDKTVKIFLAKLDDIEKFFVRTAIPDFFPILKYLVPEGLLNRLTRRDLFEKWASEFIDIVQPFIDDHVAKLDPNNPVDLMDDYLIEMMEKKSEDYSYFDLTDLTKIMFDLFNAGQDTTSNTLRWVLLYMAKFPLVQKRIQEEIDNVVERDSLPGLEHRDQLAYLDATLNEVHRHCSLIAFGLMRATGSDVILDGYHIPKNTIVFSVTATSHRDPTYWKNPDDFDPSRFLDASGKFIPTCDGFQPFGLGKRHCIGEQFARMEIYLIVAALLQKFTFCAPDDREIDLSPNPGSLFLHLPRKEKEFIIKQRK